MIDTLYKEIRNQLKAAVSALKWVDLEAGQIDNPESSYLIPYPAVLAV